MRAVKVTHAEMGDTSFEGVRSQDGVATMDGNLDSLPSFISAMLDPPNKQCLLLAQQPEVGWFAEQVFENLVAFGVVGLTHVLVPRGARTEHLEHHPGIRIILRRQEMHEHAARLVQGVLAHRLELSLGIGEAVEPRFDGDNQKQRSVILAMVIVRQRAPRSSSAACR